MRVIKPLRFKPNASQAALLRFFEIRPTKAELLRALSETQARVERLSGKIRRIQEATR